MGNKLTRSQKKKYKSKKFRKRRKESFGIEESKNSAPRTTVLVVGCGDAGKTTLCTRWRLWVEKSSGKQIPNIIDARDKALVADTFRTLLFTVVNNSFIKETPLKDQVLDEFIANFSSHYKEFSNLPFSLKVAKLLERLWKNETFQEVFALNFKYTQVETSLQYFLPQATRFADIDLILNESDLVHTHMRSTGIVSREYYTVYNRNVEIIEVAGQRSERNKWKIKYTSSDIVLFLCAISEFDQGLFENATVNRLDESLAVFDNLVNEVDLYDAKFIIVFTKTDLFEKKFNYYQGEGNKYVKDRISEQFHSFFDVSNGKTKDDFQEKIENGFLEKANQYENVSKTLFVNLLDVKSESVFHDISQVLEMEDLSP